MYDDSDAFLLTLRSPVVIDGIEYFRVWGITTAVDVKGTPFIQIGGFGHELLISPAEIKYALALDSTPDDPNVAVISGEYSVSDEDDSFPSGETAPNPDLYHANLTQ